MRKLKAIVSVGGAQVNGLREGDRVLGLAEDGTLWVAGCQDLYDATPAGPNPWRALPAPPDGKAFTIARPEPPPPGAFGRGYKSREGKVGGPDNLGPEKRGGPAIDGGTDAVSQGNQGS